MVREHTAIGDTGTGVWVLRVTGYVLSRDLATGIRDTGIGVTWNQGTWDI